MYEVTKKQRGMDGEWFSYPARRFGTEAEAIAYAESFAATQRGVAGTRIVVTRRKGNLLVREIRVG